MDEIEVCLKNLENILNEAKASINSDLSLFCSKEVFGLGRFIRIYSEILRQLDVSVNDDIAQAFESLDPSMQSYNKLLDVLSEWDRFVELIDKRAIEELKPKDFHFNQMALNESLSNDILTRQNYFRVVHSNPSSNSYISLADAFNTGNKFELDYVVLVMLRHFA
jgi:hypothetical protein